MRVLLLVLLCTTPLTAQTRSTAAHAWAAKYSIAPPIARAVMDAADANRIPRPLAFALVYVESRFKPRAISPTGAIGLTQLLLSTARDLDPAATRARLLNADYNAKLGMRYFRQMLDRYDQDPRLALIAYNDGMRSADSLARRYTTPYARKVLTVAER